MGRDGAEGGQGGGLGQVGRAWGRAHFLWGWAHFLWLRSQGNELVNRQMEPIPQHRPSLQLRTHPGPPASVHRSSSSTLCTPSFEDHPDALKPSVTEEAEVRGHWVVTSPAPSPPSLEGLVGRAWLGWTLELRGLGGTCWQLSHRPRRACSSLGLGWAVSTLALPCRVGPGGQVGL